ncbi:MAG: DUF4328 domain-containing protein [Bacteroidetes bacterium]|nr:DUF4328 domain-containing protein [Bacteroidota bacterium]
MTTLLYEDLSRRANWVYGLAAIWAAVTGVAIVHDVVQIQVVQSIVDGIVLDRDEIELVDRRQLILATTQIFLWIGWVIAYLRWNWRAYHNLASFNVVALQHSARWAAASYFVPILSYFRPYQIMREMWMASDPVHVETEETAGLAWMRSSTTMLIVWWWSAFVLAQLAAAAMFRAGRIVETAEGYLGLSWGMLISDIFELLAVALSVLIVRAITSMQSEKRMMMQQQEVVMEGVA